LKSARAIGMMCLCDKNIKSRWTRRSNFARIRRVPQETTRDWALFGSMTANDSATDVEAVVRPVVCSSPEFMEASSMRINTSIVHTQPDSDTGASSA